jgi:hypothetical protein
MLSTNAQARATTERSSRLELVRLEIAKKAAQQSTVPAITSPKQTSWEAP